MCDIGKITQMVSMCKNCIKHEVTCIGSDEQQERCFSLVLDIDNNQDEFYGTEV